MRYTEFGILAALLAFSPGVGAQTILLQPRTYTLSQPIQIPAGGALVGVPGTVLVPPNRSPAVVIGGEGATVSHVTLRGSGASAGQTGILASGVSDFTAESVRLEALSTGIAYSHNPLTRHIGPRINNTVAVGNGTGFQFSDRGEYVTVSGSYAVGNSVGVSVASGNITWVGGSVNDNLIGVELLQGDNDSHGIFSAANINHNTTAIRTDGIRYGFTFSSCHVFGGNITLLNSVGVQFVGGQYEGLTFSSTNTYGTAFDATRTTYGLVWR